MLDLSRRPALPGCRFATDPLFIRAGAGDPLDLARLAEAEGASGLLEAAWGGGTTALVALQALPLAPDAELAAGPLCDRLDAAKPREPLLRALHGIVARPLFQRERLDLTGAVRCHAALTELSRQTLPPAERDLVSSALAMLREAGIRP